MADTPAPRKLQSEMDAIIAPGHTLGSVTEVPAPGGAFYAFVKVPQRLGMTATQFKDLAKSRGVLVVPSTAFGRHDTHFRISFAAPKDKLEKGLAVLSDLMR